MGVLPAKEKKEKEKKKEENLVPQRKKKKKKKKEFFFVKTKTNQTKQGRRHEKTASVKNSYSEKAKIHIDRSNKANTFKQGDLRGENCLPKSNIAQPDCLLYKKHLPSFNENITT